MPGQIICHFHSSRGTVTLELSRGITTFDLYAAYGKAVQREASSFWIHNKGRCLLLFNRLRATKGHAEFNLDIIDKNATVEEGVDVEDEEMDDNMNMEENEVAEMEEKEADQDDGNDEEMEEAIEFVAKNKDEIVLNEFGLEDESEY